MKLFILILLFLFALTACTASEPAQAPLAEEAPLAEATLAEATLAPTESAASDVVEATPTIHPDYLPTDPANFVRAAGHPQFVEFFAYW